MLRLKPVRFLSSYPYLEQDYGRTSDLAGVAIGGVPVINQGGLAEDWPVWSLVSCLDLYIVSPAKQPHRGNTPPPTHQRSGPTIRPTGATEFLPRSSGRMDGAAM